MRLKLLTFFSALALVQLNAHAQEAPLDTLTNRVNIIASDVDGLKRIKITGYLQPQYQVADSSGISSFAGGDFASGLNKRFALRRGRVKFTYDYTGINWVLQLDATEKGVAVTDAYGKYTEPWMNAFYMQAGIFNRPWGYEIPTSSSVRETPERARWSQTLFPGERDLGAMIGFQMPKTSKWNFFSANVAMVNGTGRTASDFDFQKDLIAHIAVNKSLMNEKFKLGVGASYYSGGIRQFTNNVYSMGTDTTNVKKYILDNASANKNAIAKRSYIGADLQLSYSTKLGVTTLRGEFIQGKQPVPGNSNSSSPSTVTATTTQSITTTSGAPVLTSTSTFPDTYLRNVQGMDLYFVQNINQIKSGVVLKYDIYDPNTDVSAKEIGATGSNLNKADIAYTTLGVGYILYLNANVKFTGYYDMVTNESTAYKGFTQDLRDNVWTFRIQYKF